jgi:hypothetical protein
MERDLYYEVDRHLSSREIPRFMGKGGNSTTSTLDTILRQFNPAPTLTTPIL